MSKITARHFLIAALVGTLSGVAIHVFGIIDAGAHPDIVDTYFPTTKEQSL